MGIFEQLYPLLLPLFITGLISGFLAGLLGVGGGIVIVPILSYLLEVSGLHTQTPMHVAVASSLAIIVPTSIFSARAHFRLGNIDADVIRQLGLFVFIGASGGAIIADMLNNAALKFIFGSLAVMIGISFLIKVIMIRKDLPALGGRAITGVSIGAISALVGIGGGSLTVPTLVSCGWDMRKAVGTSALMGLVIAVPGVISFMIVGQGAVQDLEYMIGYVWLPAVAIISLGAYLSTSWGAWFGTRINKEQLRRIFGIFLVVVGARLAFAGYSAGGLDWLVG